MKNSLVAVILFLLVSSFSFAQISLSREGYSTSISIDSDNIDVAQHKGGNCNTAISINDNKHTYKFKARFPKDLYSSLNEVIASELGESNEQYRGRSEWNMEGKSVVFELRKNKLIIEMEKDEISTDTYEDYLNIVNICKRVIDDYCDGPETPTPPATPRKF